MLFSSLLADLQGRADPKQAAAAMAGLTLREASKYLSPQTKA